jgi:hypothetical protein
MCNQATTTFVTLLTDECGWPTETKAMQLQNLPASI